MITSASCSHEDCPCNYFSVSVNASTVMLSTFLDLAETESIEVKMC